MITSEKALQLVRTSAVHIADILLEIDKQITDAATRGQRKYVCFIDGLWGSIPTEQFSANHPLSVDQRLVAEQLWDCGFVVELDIIGSAYVPKGLSDDFGDGPLFVNVCLTISW